jgi:2-polyprenyl-6-methoxyphenol hydroxylase-like FAD-dependent oxidoreductase
MNNIRRVLVVGGGVGGLTAATAFARRGVEVALIERRPAFDVPGVGLGQPANALRVYDALGLLPEILASGFAYDRMSIFDPSRNLIVEHKFLLGDERVPAFARCRACACTKSCWRPPSAPVSRCALALRSAKLGMRKTA